MAEISVPMYVVVGIIIISSGNLVWVGICKVWENRDVIFSHDPDFPSILQKIEKLNIRSVRQAQSNEQLKKKQPKKKSPKQKSPKKKSPSSKS